MQPVELLGEYSTPRKTEDVRAIDARRGKEARETLCPIGDRELIRRVGGLARAGRVPGHDREPVGEVLELAPPHPRVAEETVEEHQGRTAPGGPVRDGVPSDLLSIYKLTDLNTILRSMGQPIIRVHA